MKHTGIIGHDEFSVVIAYALWLKVHFQLHGLPHVKNPGRWLYGERPAKHVVAPSEYMGRGEEIFR